MVGNKKHVTLFLWLTILGGFSFLGMQAYEWSHFIHEGARLTSNPWGVPQFSASFFIITGFFGVICAVLVQQEMEFLGSGITS
jgi:cytochrome c oxidase subunit 3